MLCYKTLNDLLYIGKSWHNLLFVMKQQQKTDELKSAVDSCNLQYIVT